MCHDQQCLAGFDLQVVVDHSALPLRAPQPDARAVGLLPLGLDVRVQQPLEVIGKAAAVGFGKSFKLGL
jgi:hypothetical protein